MAEAITISDLRIGYRNRNQTKVVAEIPSLSLAKGKLTCLLGANGIGKSTLIKTITGALPPLSGNINIGDSDLINLSIIDRAKSLALVLTDKPLLGYTTVFEMIALGRNPHTNWQNSLSEVDQAAITNALEAIGMTNEANKPLAELSDGNLQKVIIGRALAQDTNIIVLDEPTVHLDIKNKTNIIRLLKTLCRDQGKTVLLSTHDIELAQKFGDRLWVFEEGLISDGLTEDLIIDGTLNRVFSTENGISQQADQGIIIKGDPVIAELIKQAIKKRSLTEVFKEIPIEIEESREQYVYKIQGKTFSSIATLIEYQPT